MRITQRLLQPLHAMCAQCRGGIDLPFPPSVSTPPPSPIPAVFVGPGCFPHRILFLLGREMLLVLAHLSNGDILAKHFGQARNEPVGHESWGILSQVLRSVLLLFDFCLFVCLFGRVFLGHFFTPRLKAKQGTHSLVA